MRPLVLRRTLLAIVVACLGLGPARAEAKSPILELPRAERSDLSRARELDALAARAYAAGRAREALLLFTEAYRAGGPSLELWNVARCHERLDEPDDAAEVLERYLTADDLLANDRAEATRELAELRRRSSMVVVDAGHAGAEVFVDGRRIGVAPLAESVGPGRHVLRVDGRESSVDATFGRTILVRAPRASAPARTSDASAQSAGRARATLDLQAGLAAQVSGDVAGRVGPAGALGASLALVRGDFAPFVFLRGELAAFGWSTSAPERPIAACTLPDRYQASTLGALGGAGLAWDGTKSVRASLEIGAGAEALSASKGGGDVLVPSCAPSPGLVPVMGARASVSFAVIAGARVVLTPLAFTAHPAYEDARSTPRDATGTWLRLGANLGLAYDLAL